jgi:hypothetical protein
MGSIYEKLKAVRTLRSKKIKLLTKRAKCSIYEHSKTEHRDINLFRRNLKNNIHHVFGHHSKCSDGTCNTVGNQTESQIPDLKNWLKQTSVKSNFQHVVYTIFFRRPQKKNANIRYSFKLQILFDRAADKTYIGGHGYYNCVQ